MRGLAFGIILISITVLWIAGIYATIHFVVKYW